MDNKVISLLENAQKRLVDLSTNKPEDIILICEIEETLSLLRESEEKEMYEESIMEYTQIA